MEQFRSHVLVCTGGGCIASGALAVSAAFSEELEKQGLASEVQVVETGCLGPCAVGPVALVYPDGVFYQNIKVPDVAEIVEEHLLKGRVVPRLVSTAPGTEKSIAEMHDVEFFNRQVKIVLRNSGLIDPLKHRGLHRPRRLRRPRQGDHRDDPREHRRRSARLGPARPRRRRVPDRPQVALRPAAERGDQVHPLQRRRRRPGRVHGPLGARRRPALGDRGHGHRRLRDRRPSGLRLRARRVPAGRRAPAVRHRPGARVRPASATTSSVRALPSTSRSAWAPAPSSAAKRPRS